MRDLSRPELRSRTAFVMAATQLVICDIVEAHNAVLCGAAGLGPVCHGRVDGPVSRCPILAVAYRAKSMAPIGVQFVKDTLRLVNGTGGPARRS